MHTHGPGVSSISQHWRYFPVLRLSVQADNGSYFEFIGYDESTLNIIKRASGRLIRTPASVPLHSANDREYRDYYRSIGEAPGKFMLGVFMLILGTVLCKFCVEITNTPHKPTWLAIVSVGLWAIVVCFIGQGTILSLTRVWWPWSYYTIAVAAETGKEVWRTKMGEINKGETMTMAPLLAKDKVLVGDSGGELGVRG
jgi:outer membrane protein assembly factor BamB